VLNNGTPSISGFNLVDRKLTALAGPARSLSGADADPAQGSFTAGGGALIATERGTNSISSDMLDEHGYAQAPTDQLMSPRATATQASQRGHGGFHG